METLRCSSGLGAEHRGRGSARLCPAHLPLGWNPPIAMDGKWNAPTNQLTIATQLDVGSEPGEPTNGYGRYHWQQVLSHRPIISLRCVLTLLVQTPRRSRRPIGWR